MKRRLLALPLLVSAGLAGAGGLGLESILIAYAGLAAGQSLAHAHGIGAFVAGWACGAWIAGRWSARGRIAVAVLVAALAGTAWGASHLLQALGGDGGSAALAGALALGCIALSAVPQGMLLPWILRAWERALARSRVAPLYVASLLGALAGAWLLGFVAVSRWGRPTALGLACSASVVAIVLTLLVGPRAAATGDASRRAAERGAMGRASAGWIVAWTTLWTLGLEWLCLRLAVLWVGSEAFELTLVLAASLFALAAGAAVLPALLPSNARGAALVLTLAALGSTWPLWAADALRWSARHGDVATTLTLTFPTLFALGAVVPVVHAACSGEAARRLGDLLAFEMGGALCAGALVHGALVPNLGVGGAIAALCACAPAAALVLLRVPSARAAAGLTCVVALACGGLAFRAREPALASPKLTDPALSVRAFREDQHFAVSVVDDGLLGERTLLTDQFRAAGNGRDYHYMRVLGHLPLLLHPHPRAVAVVALGTGTTLGAVSLHREVEHIDVLEISPAVVAFSSWFGDVNRGVLASGAGDPRVAVVLGDGRRTLAERAARYDVITIEPLLPDSPFGVYLYTPEFYAVVRRALAPGGSFCQWVPPHALEPAVFDAVLQAFARSFEHASAWLFGTQVLLLGGERAPSLDAARLAGLDPQLAQALSELGLAAPAGLAARFVADLREWPAVERSLRDVDPWIAWRRKERGSTVLGWLPRNLERLTQLGSESPWSTAFAGSEQLASVRALHEARIALGWSELELRSGGSDASGARTRALAALSGLPQAALREPEVRAFVDEVEFLFAIRTGIGALQGGDTRTALDRLLRAAELRPERADVHAYVAAALSLGGYEAGAKAAAARARELCPRLIDTPQGRRAIALGLEPAWIGP